MDDTEFTKQLVACRSYLRRFALRNHTRGNEIEAEDLVQETLLGAWQYRHSFRGQSRFKTWLTSIMNNKAWTAYRRSKRVEYGTPAYEHGVDQLSVDANQQHTVELRDMDERISKLSPQHRQVFVGMRVMGNTQQELALAANVPEKTIGSRMHYAHKKLLEASL